MDKVIIYEYEVGQKVNHDVFGKGEVVEVENRLQCRGCAKDQPIVTVEFENDVIPVREFNGSSLHDHEVK